MASSNDKRLVLLITCMTAFITPFLASSLNIALPTVNADFAVTDQALLNWTVTIYMLSAAIFVVPFGRIADEFGRKKVFVTGLSIVVISSILCALSNSILMLIAARAIEGFGSAMIFGTSMAILTSVYPLKERGKVLGINVAITYAGLSLGPVLGGFITEYLGWRYIYGGIVLYTLLVALLASWKIKEEWQCAESAKFDLPGTVMYAAMLISLMYGLSQVQTPLGAGLFALSLLLMAVFFWWELHQKNPVLKVSVFRKNTVFMFSNLAALINYSATSAVALMLSYYLQYMHMLKPDQAGLVMIAQPVMMAIFSPMTGRLSDRVEPRIVASAGMGLCAIGLVLFALLTPETSLLLVVAGLVFMGLGFALFSSPNTNAIMSSVEKCDYGVASGMVSTMRLIGQMLSLGLANLIFTTYMGHAEIPKTGPYDTLMQSIQVAFIVMAVLCVIGVILSLARGNLRTKARAPVVAPEAIRKT
jgi:EmrB/QacA subfamily drug resistance transporter